MTQPEPNPEQEPDDRGDAEDRITMSYPVELEMPDEE
ncbi:hypothetical protein C5N14_13665 [Micromonospora sp. MW-13]|nr:hypothetical protein C5N14_13665 [Micromonospora sp. MW-13]